jgi:hypothetical protein
MDSSVYAALIALGLIVITSVGAIVKALTDRVLSDLANNTRLTEEAKDAANDRLQKIVDQLAAERNRTLALRELVRERDDRFAYLTARVPQVATVLRGYEERRQERHTPADEQAALERILDDPPAH